MGDGARHTVAHFHSCYVGAASFTEIVTRAREGEYDLIVLGTHGRRGLARVLMGSDAEPGMFWPPKSTGPPIDGTPISTNFA